MIKAYRIATKITLWHQNDVILYIHELLGAIFNVSYLSLNVWLHVMNRRIKCGGFATCTLFLQLRSPFILVVLEQLKSASVCMRNMHVGCLRLPACFPDKNKNTPKFFPIVDKTFTLVLVFPSISMAFSQFAGNIDTSRGVYSSVIHPKCWGINFSFGEEFQVFLGKKKTSKEIEKINKNKKKNKKNKMK